MIQHFALSLRQDIIHLDAMLHTLIDVVSTNATVPFQKLCTGVD